MILISYIAKVIGREAQTEQGFSFAYEIAANSGINEPVIRRGSFCVEAGKRIILFECIIAFEVHVQVAQHFTFWQQAYRQIGDTNAQPE